MENWMRGIWRARNRKPSYIPFITNKDYPVYQSPKPDKKRLESMLRNHVVLEHVKVIYGFLYLRGGFLSDNSNIPVCEFM